MSKFLINLTFIIAAFLSAASSVFAQDVVLFEKKESNDKPTPPPLYSEKPDNRHRMPSRPILGYIDWENHTLTIDTDTEDAISFEIWQNDVCILATSDQTYLLKSLLTSCAYPTIIVANFPDYKLVGTYDPSE